MSFQRQMLKLEDEHDELEHKQSPFMTEMERHYVNNPAGFRGKIMMATWISRKRRVHMIDHIKALLQRKAKEKRRIRRVSLTRFARDPTVKRAQTKRFNFSKRGNGTVWKQNKRTGRFAKFSQREHRIFRRPKEVTTKT